MSTKPPTAVMMPSVSSRGFKAVLDRLERLDVSAEFLRGGGVRLLEQRPDFSAVRGIGLRERRRRRLQLLADASPHGPDIGGRKLQFRRLLVDQRPFGRLRARLA